MFIFNPESVPEYKNDEVTDLIKDFMVKSREFDKFASKLKLLKDENDEIVATIAKITRNKRFLCTIGNDSFIFSILSPSTIVINEIFQGRTEL